MDIESFGLEEDKTIKEAKDSSEVVHNGINMRNHSPSTANSFIERRPAWFASKVKGAPFCANPAMARGTAVEHAINEWLRLGDDSIPNLTEIAQAKFDQELVKFLATAGPKGKEDYTSMRASIPGLVKVAYEHFSMKFTFGKPISQGAVDLKIPGLKLKTTGYMDYFQPGKVVTDCKVTSKTPSSLSQGYQIQGSVYNRFTGCPVEFDFIVATKDPKVVTIRMTDDECVFGMSYYTRTCEVLEEIQSCPSPKRMMELMCWPDLSAFWNYEEKLQAAKEHGITLR
jgi:hypothetical protein